MLGEVVVVVVVVLPRPRGWVDEAAAADAMVIGIGIGPITIKFDCEFNTVQRQTDELKKLSHSSGRHRSQAWVAMMAVAA